MTLLEEVLVDLRAVGVFTMSVLSDRGEDAVPEASIILVLDVDDRVLLGQEFGQLSKCSTGQGVEFCHLESKALDLVDHQT